MGPGPGDREGPPSCSESYRRSDHGFNGARPWGPGGTPGSGASKGLVQIALQWGPALGTGRDPEQILPGAAALVASMGPGPGDREGPRSISRATSRRRGFNGARPWGPGGTVSKAIAVAEAWLLQWGPALGTGRDPAHVRRGRHAGHSFNGARPWGPGGTSFLCEPVGDGFMEEACEWWYRGSGDWASFVPAARRTGGENAGINSTTMSASGAWLVGGTGPLAQLVKERGWL